MRKRYILLALGCVGITVAALMMAMRREHQDLYRMTILPSLGGKVTTLTGLNNQGQAVGYSEAADGSCHLCLWDREGRVQDLGPAIRSLFRLNDAGQIAGTTLDAHGNEVAFLWDGARGTRMLGTLGGAESVALGLNNGGQVVGWSRTAAGLKHAFVWDETTGMRDLGTPEGDGSEARAINDNGQIVGVSDQEPGRPAWWALTGPASVGRQLRGFFGFSDINTQGCTAGRLSFRDGRDFMVLWWPDGAPKKLFPVDQEIQRWPAISDANQILFAERHRRWLEPIRRKILSPESEYYVWDPNRGRIGLNRHVPTKRGERVEFFDLNDRGCLAGHLLGPGLSYVSGVLLEPIPERWRKPRAR